MKKKSKSYWKKKCDSVFSKIVKYKARCIETDTIDNLQCAHIISRSYHAVRYDFNNAVPLTVRRHVYYTYHPLEWEKFIIKKFGNKYLSELKKKALQYKSLSLKDYEELYNGLEKKLERLTAYPPNANSLDN